MGMSGYVVEHGETPFTRRLRRRRIQVAVAIAAVEGLLLLVGVLPWWVAIVAATAAVAVYVWVGREHASPAVRAFSWVAAASQLIVVLVPVAIVLVGLLAVVAVVLLAAIALALVLLDRR
jgi:hypothetical protein